MQVGAAIHKLRKDRKMTLLELSKKSGVALATLSRMENGRMTGTLDSHIRIAEALGIRFTDLYKDLVTSKKQVELPKKSAAEVSPHKKPYLFEILASKISNKKMMPCLFKIHKGGSTDTEETKTGIEKFIYIIDGRIDAHINDEKYSLNKGSTLYFDSSIPHHFKNTGNGEAVFISVTSPPTL